MDNFILGFVIGGIIMHEIGWYYWKAFFETKDELTAPKEDSK